MDNEKKPTKITKTWFLERGDGKIFACSELEAWNTLRHKGNWQRNDFKIIGVSDGSEYVRVMKSATNENTKIENEISVKSTDLTRYLNTLDKFKFELLLEDTDEKVVKVKGIIENLKKEIETLSKQVSLDKQSIFNKAFEAELAKAKGHIEFPQNQDIATPRGDRETILKNLPR